jgi:hypothetical protein
MIIPNPKHPKDCRGCFANELTCPYEICVVFGEVRDEAPDAGKCSPTLFLRCQGCLDAQAEHEGLLEEVLGNAPGTDEEKT